MEAKVRVDNGPGLQGAQNEGELWAEGGGVGCGGRQAKVI